VVEDRARTTRSKDGTSWRIGESPDVSWIVEGTVPGLTITSAIPPIFEAYATIIVPDFGNRASGDGAVLKADHDRAILTALIAHSADQPWWLGYLDTGADDIVFSDAPMVTLYTGWPYVLVEAGPEQAARWKAPTSWRGALPDIIFPADRTWLLSTLWDDDWRCVGGPAELIVALHRDPTLSTRVVGIDEDATPPGHQAR
jgi:hypothetical protein